MFSGPTHVGDLNLVRSEPRDRSRPVVGTANRGGNDQGENAGRATGALSSSDAAGMLGFGNDGMIIMVVRINIMEVLQIRETFCREYPGC